MKKNKLLIISYRFPPMNAIASRRWNEMIPYLEEEFDVYVFTMNSKGDLPCFLNEGKIKRVGFQKNYEVEGEYKTSFIHKIVNKFTNEIQTFESTWVSWFWNYKTPLLEYFDEIQPEIVITTVGPYSTALFAKMLRWKKRNFKWLCDVRDPGYIYQLYTKNFLQKLVDKLIEKWLFKDTDLLIATIGDSMKIALEKLHSKRVYQIFNGYIKGDYSKIKKSNDKTILYYAGRIYPHREGSLKLLLSSIRDFPDVEFNINLMAQPNRKKAIIQITKNFHNVNVLPPVSASKVSNSARQCDILVLLENIEPHDDIDLGVITGKLFGYLPYIAPILAICSKRSNISEILFETKKGITTDLHDEICQFVNGHYKNYTGDDDKISYYSREQQANQLIQLIIRKLI